MSENSTIIQAANAELKGVIGYDPYFVDNTDKVRCTACHGEVTDLTNLKTTKNVKTVEGVPMVVHACPTCKYVQGVNLPLKKRINEYRKELNLHEFPQGEKFKNKYAKPQDVYTFIIPTTGDATRLSEYQLQMALEEARGSNIIKTSTIVEVTSSESAETSTVEAAAPVVQETPVVVATESEDHLPTLSDITGGTDEEDEREDVIDDDLPIHDKVAPAPDGEESDEVMDGTGVETGPDASDFFDDDDLSNLFNTQEAPIAPVTIVNEEELPVGETIDVSVIEDEATDVEEDDDTSAGEMFGADDDLEAFFAGCATASTDTVVPPVQQDNPHVSGVEDVKVTTDPTIEAMLKANSETSEDDVFRLDKREQSGIGNLVRRSRTADLHENYADSNAKLVVDRITSLFKKRVNRPIRTNVTINELTHECPVVDIEGNIRLIFVDIDVPGGRYDIQQEINSKLKAPYADTSDFELITYMIFSDEIEDKKLNRVVKAVAKNVAYNLKILGVFSPISIMQESNRFFYTTVENDKEIISRFDMENCAGNVDKPCNGEVAIVSEWLNPNVDDAWRYQKYIRNRSIIASGGDIDYKDLSMYMVCTMKYIVLPQKPDGSINVTITEYIEALDLFVRDGFGILVAALLHNIKTQYPQSKIHLYYEIDVSMIPSPTISRYVKGNAIRPINIDESAVHLNKIAGVLANQAGIKVPSIYVEGEPFDSPEYQSNIWRSYNLSPEFRRNAEDGKRIDWRKFGRKSFGKTLGDRFKDYRNIDVNDRKKRAALLEQLGYHTIIQPQVIKTRIADECGLNALQLFMQKCSGIFSIAQFTRGNRSQVVNDNYMVNNIGGVPTYNPAMGGYITPEQQQAYAYQMNQQAAYQQMFGNGGMYPNR